MVNTHTDEQWLQTVLGELNFLVWTKNVQTGEITFLNDCFESLYHRSREEFELNPQLLSEIVHPDDALDYLLFSKPMQHRGDIEVRYRVKLPNGQWKWLGERRKIKKNEAGKITTVHAIVTDISNRMKAESEKEEIEKAYHQFFHKNSYPLWIYDVETLEFLEVNEAAVRQYGYSRTEFLRMTVKQIRPKEDVPFLLQMLSVELKDHDIPKFWRHRRKDGTVFYVKVLSNRVMCKGRIANMILAVDVSKELAVNNPYEPVLNPKNLPTHYYLVLNKQGIVEFADQGICTALQITAEDLVGRNISSITTDLNPNNEWSKALKRSSGDWQGLLQWAPDKGRSVFSARLVNPPDGLQMLLLLQSSTRHQELTEKILSFDRNLRELLNTVTDGLVLLDPKMKIMLANPQFAILVNQPLEVLAGRKLWDFLSPDDSIRLNQFIKKAIRKQETIRFDEYFPALNAWFDVSVYPSQEGLTVYFRDITGRKAQEEEKQDLLHHLMAQNKAMEEFAYLTSHNVRTHVANIQMLSSLLSGISSDEHEIVSKIKASSIKLDQITRDLSQMLSIQSREGFKLEAMNLEPIVHKVLSRYKLGAQDLSKITQIEVDANIKIKAFDVYVEAVISQLVQNAIRYRQEGVDFRLTVLAEEDGPYVFFLLEDNGQGFEIEQHRHQLFGLFKTFHPSIKGRGLGLYMVKMMLDSMGACIDIDSKPGKGTKIMIQLPAA